MVDRFLICRGCYGPQPRVNVSEQEIREFCQKHRIRGFSFFGSVLSANFRPDSDIDILVESEEGYTPTFLKLARMEQELSQILKGCQIDLRTLNELSRFFHQDVVDSAWVVYAAS